MSVVAITGVAGYLGQRLLGLLGGDDAVDRIIGLDAAEPSLVSPKLEFHHTDVRDPRLPKILAGADVLVHLAWVVDPIRDEREMWSANVEGTRNVFLGAAAAGLSKIVYTSSATVYGAHPDNDFPLTEGSPLRANVDLAYAAHKLEAERFIEAFREDHPGTVVTVLRPAIVFGPNVENFVSRYFESPRLLVVKGYRPPWQFVHEEDVASALYHAVANDLDGAYNVSADGWLPHAETLELSGKKEAVLPEAVAFSAAERLWRAGLSLGPPAELHYIMHPWVVDNARLRETGWAPRHSNRSTLQETLETHRPWVTVGRWRARRTDVARGAAAAVAAVAALAIARKRRKRDP